MTILGLWIIPNTNVVLYILSINAFLFSVAPVKALCSERFTDWQNKFNPLGLKCMELTGDTELDDYFELQAVNIIFTTPVCITFWVVSTVFSSLA